MPTYEAEYTYAVVPCLPNTACLQTRRSPYTDIAGCIECTSRQCTYESIEMKNKLSEMASIAEIIGAFAVVISLIYVGVQVNDSAGAVRSASANDANVAVQNWYL